MMVLIIEKAPTALRGRLTLWLFEVKSNVFVGKCNSKLRDWIWNTTIENIGNGSAILLYSTNASEFGFEIKSFGMPSRCVYDLDGIKILTSIYK